VIAKGGETAANKGSDDNPAVALRAVLGNVPPANVVINEMTTVASVWTHAQFLDGHAIKGNALGLRIAPGNVHNFVDLATGGYGAAIQDAVNSTQTTTMANFATLSSLLADCTTRIRPDASARLFAAATPPGGKMAIDSKGNAWITNTLGTGLDVTMKLKLLELKLTGKMGQLHRILFDYLHSNPSLGSISMLRPDGIPAPGSSWGLAFTGIEDPVRHVMRPELLNDAVWGWWWKHMRLAS
jgi:hypothetical protein